ncbi:hypothetical protein AN958_11365 [Leucoagaricus sp. SymC.cos]|nr:hypothetical protein AN958_11365 [Leucoagaricus sp. SymC.cos]
MVPNSELDDIYFPFRLVMIQDEIPSSSEDGSGLRSPVGGVFPRMPQTPSLQGGSEFFRYQHDPQVDISPTAGVLAPRFDFAQGLNKREPRKWIAFDVRACRYWPECNNCVRRNNECEYDAMPKRRGPDKRPGTLQRKCISSTISTTAVVGAGEFKSEVPDLKPNHHRGHDYLTVFDGHAGKNASEWRARSLREDLCEAPGEIRPSPAFYNDGTSLSRVRKEYDGMNHSRSFTTACAFSRVKDDIQNFGISMYDVAQNGKGSKPSRHPPRNSHNLTSSSSPFSSLTDYQSFSGGSANDVQRSSGPGGGTGLGNGQGSSRSGGSRDSGYSNNDQGSSRGSGNSNGCGGGSGDGRGSGGSDDDKGSSGWGDGQGLSKNRRKRKSRDSSETQSDDRDASDGEDENEVPSEGEDRNQDPRRLRIPSDDVAQDTVNEEAPDDTYLSSASHALDPSSGSWYDQGTLRDLESGQSASGGFNNPEGTTWGDFGALGGISALLFAVIAAFWIKYSMSSIAEHAIWLTELFAILALITASMGFLEVRNILRAALHLATAGRGWQMRPILVSIWFMLAIMTWVVWFFSFMWSCCSTSSHATSLNLGFKVSLSAIFLIGLALTPLMVII